MEMKQIRKFPEGLLQHISKTIAEYSSITEISELIKISGFKKNYVITGTKWKALYEFLLTLNLRPVTRKHIVKIIETFCEPTRWIGYNDVYYPVLDELNEGLIYAKMQLTQKGKIKPTIIKKVYSINQKNHQKEAEKFSSTYIIPAFKIGDIRKEDNICFVLMPFKPSFERLYVEKIKPSVESCGLKCLKANDLFSPTPILEDIIKYIKTSKIIIADVTERNANVFYEMGIAHTLNKPVIIITQEKKDIPFDIAQMRYFHYSDDANGWEILCKNIVASINSIIRKK